MKQRQSKLLLLLDSLKLDIVGILTFCGIVVPLRRSNCRKIDELAPALTQDAPATPSYGKR